MRQDKTLLGVALMLGFCTVAPLLDVFAKLAAVEIPIGQVVTMRFLGQAVLMAPFCILFGLGLTVARGLVGLVALRAALLILATYSFIGAISVMPIADALAIVFIEPFLILLAGKFFLGEEVGPRRMAAAGVGFVGVLMVIQPSFAAFGPVAFLPLVTAVSFGAYIVVTRAISDRLEPVVMQFQTAFWGSLICIPILWLSDGRGWFTLDPVWPEGIYWLWLAGVGFFATISHMMMTTALKYAPSATLAPLHYMEIVSAVAFGYMVFGDFPNRLALSGIVVILVSGLYVIHRERIASRIQDDQAARGAL